MNEDQIRSLADQDQRWMELDRWYAEQDSELMFDLVESLDCEPSESGRVIRNMDDIEADIIRRLTMHILLELAQRNVLAAMREDA